ncbi:MAG: hypothetical protein AABX37_03825, partial [Nanoarchaeota archaeon]
LYYLPGQEAQVYQHAASNLNPKDYQVAERLRQQKILREVDLDLLSKVALRTVKDFAIPIHVTVNDQKELFWKWYLLSEAETNSILSALLSPPEPRSEQERQLPLLEPEPQEEQTTAQRVETPQGILSAPQEQQSLLVAEQEGQSPSVHNENSVNFRNVPKIKDFPEQKGKLPLLEPESPSEERKTKRSLTRSPKKSIIDEFLPLIEDFCKHHRIEIEEKETIRKNAEMNFKVRVPSTVGKTVYFCKAKSKTKCDEKDISAAYMEAQRKRLPLLFLYTGEIHKKAQDMLDSGTLENMIIKRLE